MHGVLNVKFSDSVVSEELLWLSDCMCEKQMYEEVADMEKGSDSGISTTWLLNPRHRLESEFYLSHYLTNFIHKICFTISFISCLYMFRAHVLETCRGMK